MSSRKLNSETTKHLQVLAGGWLSPRARGAWAFAFKCALAILLVAWLVRSGRLDGRAWQILRSPSATTRFWLILALTFQCGMLAFQAARWQVLVRALGQKISTRHAVIGTMRGACLGSWTPAGLGLDGVRCVLLANRASSAARAEAQRTGLIAALLDRANGLSSLLLIWALMRSPPLVLGVMAFLVVIFGVVPRRGALGKGMSSSDDEPRGRLSQWWNQVMELKRTQPRALVGSWLLAAATHACNIAAFACILLALEPNLAWKHGAELSLQVAPSVVLATAIPLTPLGLGVADGVSEALLSARGVNSGGEIVMLLRAVWLLLCLACGVAFWIRADDSTPTGS